MRWVVEVNMGFGAESYVSRIQLIFFAHFLQFYCKVQVFWCRRPPSVFGISGASKASNRGPSLEVLWTKDFVIQEAIAWRLMDILLSALIFLIAYGFFRPELPLWRSWTEQTCFHFLRFSSIVLKLVSEPIFLVNFIPASTVDFVRVIISIMKILSLIFRRAFKITRCHDTGLV